MNRNGNEAGRVQRELTLEEAFGVGGGARVDEDEISVVVDEGDGSHGLHLSILKRGVQREHAKSTYSEWSDASSLEDRDVDIIPWGQSGSPESGPGVGFGCCRGLSGCRSPESICCTIKGSGLRGGRSGRGFLGGGRSDGQFGRRLPDSVVDSGPVGPVLDVPWSLLGASREADPFGGLGGGDRVPAEGRADRGGWPSCNSEWNNQRISTNQLVVVLLGWVACPYSRWIGRGRRTDHRGSRLGSLRWRMAGSRRSPRPGAAARLQKDILKRTRPVYSLLMDPLDPRGD